MKSMLLLWGDVESVNQQTRKRDRWRVFLEVESKEQKFWNSAALSLVQFEPIMRRL